MFVFCVQAGCSGEPGWKASAWARRGWGRGELMAGRG